MERTANQPVQNDRTRYLNIVYFVESARSHTIRINLRYARWAIGAAAIIFAWAAGSVFWIVSLRWQVEETRDRLESSLTTIFDYQIKNDKVFEIAYPAEATKSYYSEAAQLASNNPTLDSKSQADANPEMTAPKTVQTTSNQDPKPSLTHKVQATAQPTKTPGKPDASPAPTAAQQTVGTTPAGMTHQTSQPSAAQTQSVATNNASAAQTVATTNPIATANTKTNDESKALIDVSGAKLSRTGSKLELVFDINNRRSERASGYIWAVAAFTGTDGKTTYSAAPNHVQLDSASGKIRSVKTAYRFAIQRYKKKDFEFKAPTAKDWKLTKMTIHFTDMNNSKEETVNVPVDHFASSQSQEKPAEETSL